MDSKDPQIDYREGSRSSSLADVTVAEFKGIYPKECAWCRLQGSLGGTAKTSRGTEPCTQGSGEVSGFSFLFTCFPRKLIRRYLLLYIYKMYFSQ